uniref:Putative secreted protein n=1 Tax=Anopheles darlingi TaxID=43151 RepID=A0A2M4DII4_ANODA
MRLWRWTVSRPVVVVAVLVQAVASAVVMVQVRAALVALWGCVTSASLRWMLALARANRTWPVRLPKSGST